MNSRRKNVHRFLRFSQIDAEVSSPSSLGVSRSQVPRYLNYVPQLAFCVWQLAANDFILRGFPLISSRSGIFFQILRALLYKPPERPAV
jgi:hypothetical protein